MGNEQSQYRVNSQMGIIGIQPLLLDFFCGGGGVSTGIEKALGRGANFLVGTSAIYVLNQKSDIISNGAFRWFLFMPIVIFLEFKLVSKLDRPKEIL